MANELKDKLNTIAALISQAGEVLEEVTELGVLNREDHEEYLSYIHRVCDEFEDCLNNAYKRIEQDEDDARGMADSEEYDRQQNQRG